MKRLGLFVIPIKFDESIETYSEYVDFACQIEKFGYTHLFIGEHLTDPREDIQSAIVFASAVAAKTKKIIICLSVLALPHYNIQLLIKQIEDLYRLSNGRVMIGIGPGALKTDADYLGFEHSKRPFIFSKKLEEFKKYLQNSDILSEIPNSNIFSTLLSTYPSKAFKLREEGYSILSSNFTSFYNYKNHVECILKGSKNKKSLGNWHVIYNVVPDDILRLSDKSIEIIKKTYEYIFNKLGDEKGKSIMLPNLKETLNKKDISTELFKQLTISESDLKIEIDKMNRNYQNGFPIINLFDCLSDKNYKNFLISLPKNIHHK